MTRRVSNKQQIFFIVTTAIALSLIAMVPQYTTVEAQTPPPLENTNDTDKADSNVPSFGKITIQVSQTEQIVLDLPLKSDNTYKIVPIK